MQPQLGDAVELADGTRAVVSVAGDYGPELLGICRLSDLYGGAMFFGPHYGRPDPAHPEVDHCSVSGGPHPSVRLENFTPTDETAEVPCWHWKDRPRAHSAVSYTRTVPLWRVALLLALASCAPHASPDAERTFVAALNTYCDGSDYREPICGVPLSQDFGR